MPFVLPKIQMMYSSENLILKFPNLVQGQFGLELTVYHATQVFQRLLNALDSEKDARQLIDDYREMGFATSKEMDYILSTLEDELHEYYYYFLAGDPRNVLATDTNGLVQGKFSIKFNRKVTLYYEFNRNGQGVLFVK